MILLTILACIVIGIVFFALITAVVGGAGFLIAFADVIVCAAFVFFVVKHLIGK